MGIEIKETRKPRNGNKCVKVFQVWYQWKFKLVGKEWTIE